jgi:restriction endonuclease S subunit
MGATLRGRDATRPDPNGSFQFVRIGDISQDGTLRSKDFVRIEPNESVPEDLWLCSGDVLFPNRGTRTTALAFPIDAPRIIVGPQFFIVRPDRNRVLPEYLAWFLRSPQSAAHFDSRRKGTYVQIVQRKDLAELELPLPPLEKQRQIVGVAALALRERELSEQIQNLQWRYTNEILVRLASGNNP